MTKSFVEMHTGRISIISELNKGSEFIIELPDVKVESDQNCVEYNSNRIMGNTEVINIELSDIYTMESNYDKVIPK